ncbi:MAG: hypothetical protein ABSE73_23645 [Planctomycetota bacterium]
MSRIESIQKQIRGLTPKELAHLRDWFLEFDWEAWDRQLERDSRAGKFDSVVRKVLEDHAAGRTTRLRRTEALKQSAPLLD